MVDVDKLSDAELRTKLIEFGFPVMPITGTTRKVMTKKLKLLLENKNKANSDGRRSLGRYSSEEESDTEVSSTRRAEKNRRATMAAPVMQPPSSSKVNQRKSARINDTINDEVPSKNVIRKEVTTTTTRTARILQNTPLDEFDTGSDSESEIVANNYKSTNDTFKRSSPVKPTLSYTSNLTNRYSPTKSVDRDSSFSSRNASMSSTTSPGRTPSFISTNAAEDRLNEIRSRLSLSSGYQPMYSSNTPPRTTGNDRGDGNAPDTPFLSNFTKRLSQLSPQNKSNEYEYKNDIIKEHDTNGAGSYPVRAINRPLRSRDLTYTYKNGSQSSVLKNNLVPFAVLAVAFLFFVFVAIMYLGIRSDTTVIETAGYTIPYCVYSDPKSKKGVNCILETELKNAVNLLHVLEPELTKVAVDKVCKNPNIRSHMTEEEIIEYIKKNYALQDDFQIRSDLTNLEILAFKNPNWGISVLQTNNINAPISQENVAQNMEQVIFNRETKVTSLAILEPSIPWRCSFYQKLYTTFTTIISIAAIFLALYCGKTAYKYYKVYYTRQREEVIYMVEKIIDILQTNASENPQDGENYLVINHVRDLILPITERKRKQNVWAKAVKFINENESRIRTEVQEVQGEPFEVWRWLGSANLSMSGSPRNKSWQGQAFETQTGAVNSLPCSPTPCLKIRGMVEDGDRNTHMIREAILSKCAHQCRVLHCAVDVSSKCVYLKCSDTSDAAVAYRNLHGWWYAGHLVTVKYLRLERYMQRFPESPLSGPPFLKAINPSSDW